VLSWRQVSRRGSFFVAALGGLVFAAAGCGGSKGPTVASLGTTTTAGQQATSARPSAASLATCLTSHGIAAAVGSGAGGSSGSHITIAGVTVTGNADPGSPQFQAAVQACRKFLPGGGPPQLTPAQQAAASKAMLRFAECMRAHGLPNFPDPNSDGRFPLSGLRGVGPSSPLAASAFKKCESLQPKVGPRIVIS